MTKLFTIAIFAFISILATFSIGQEVNIPLTDQCQDTINLQDLASRISGNDDKTQFQTLTNIIQTTFGSNFLSDSDSQMGCSLLKRALTLPRVRSDPNALYYCAQAFSIAQGISTNAYQAELLVAYNADMELQEGEPRKPGIAIRGKYWGPNLRAFHAKWEPILEHNRVLLELREYGIIELCDALACYCLNHGKDEGSALKARILKLKSLSDKERKRLVGEEFFRRANASESELEKVR